jgi:hypothetical protein
VRTWRQATLFVLAIHATALPILALACGRIAPEETSSDAGDAGDAEGAGSDVSYSDRPAQLGNEIDYEHYDEPPSWVFDGCVCPPPPQCPAPAFAPPSGTAFQAGAGIVTITDATLPANGFIYFTTDGTNPNVNSQVYVGPLQVVEDVTFRAAAQAPGCTMSNVVLASYTVVPGDGPPDYPVTFNPGSSISNNDLLVALTGAPGAAICYTLDGSAPTCTNGQCTGTSLTYSAATRVAIRGDVTDPATGLITVTAIECEAGSISSVPVSQVYTLQAADPTMTNPAPGPAVPWTPNSVQPLIATATVDSNTPVSIHLTYGGPTTCTTGATYANDSNVYLTSSSTISALACKTGYLPSAVKTFDYVLQFAPPYLDSLVGGTQGEPGWDWAGTGEPVTTMTIPDAGAAYGPFLVYQVGDPPCTGTAGAPEPASCSGAPNALADYVCWSKNGPASCGCASPLALTTATPYATLPASADVGPGDTLSVVACQSSPPVNAIGVFAAASTTVTFQ